MAKQGSTINPSVVNAAAPFDDPKADVILRSSDNVDFRCHKLLLSMSSTFFEGMFSLPQPNGADGDEKKDGLHVVPVEEKAAILELILRFCHPSSIRNPPTLELDAIKSVFNAARKYGMEDAEHIARAALVSPRLLASEPLRVFVIACILKFAMEARVAATATLEFDVEELDYVPELESISGSDIFHLRRYHNGCRKAARDASDLAWGLHAGEKEHTWRQCTIDSKICPNASRKKQVAVKWWIEGYLVPCQESLENRPSGRSVKVEQLFVTALKGAEECPHCSKTRLEEMRAFAEKFGEEIDKAVAKVQLSLTWAEPDEDITQI